MYFGELILESLFQNFLAIQKFVNERFHKKLKMSLPPNTLETIFYYETDRPFVSTDQTVDHRGLVFSRFNYLKGNLLQKHVISKKSC